MKINSVIKLLNRQTILLNQYVTLTCTLGFNLGVFISKIPQSSFIKNSFVVRSKSEPAKIQIDRNIYEILYL